MSELAVPYGGAFLVEEASPDHVFIPEELPAEARLVAKTMEDYVRKEVLPLVPRTEAHEEGLMRTLVQGAGELGLLAAGVPQMYGGVDLPKSTLALLTEKAAPNASFAISVGAHTGISTLPLLYFGTAEQKQKYLPKLASGEMIGAFCLSEANSGSDALAAKSKATRSADGKHYVLTGTKMWTTNAGFADLFTVFMKVDGEQFTAFLVERDTPGVSLGREEEKLGLRGSSTRRVIFEDAPVPVENVLGEVGKGYRPALYSLNIGRFNIGSGALGACKETLRIATTYANQRAQFGKPIAEFGMIQHKLGEIAVQTFVLESMVYRISGYWDVLFGRIDAAAPDVTEQYRAASEEHAIECAIMKFFGSEVLDYVVDEGLQIHGGFGYSEEFPMARAYRDARINRIFEGTNEINRMTVVDQAFRRVQHGRLPLQQAIARVRDAVLSPSPDTPGQTPLEETGDWVKRLRTAALYVAGQAWEALGESLAERQEVCGAVADMCGALFALESAWLRLGKLKSGGSMADKAGPWDAGLAAVQVFGADACARAEQYGRYACAGFSSGDALRTHALTLRRIIRQPLTDTISLRRQIAALVREREGYPW